METLTIRVVSTSVPRRAGLSLAPLGQPHVHVLSDEAQVETARTLLARIETPGVTVQLGEPAGGGDYNWLPAPSAQDLQAVIEHFDPAAEKLTGDHKSDPVFQLGYDAGLKDGQFEIQALRYHRDQLETQNQGLAHAIELLEAEVQSLSERVNLQPHNPPAESAAEESQPDDAEAAAESDAAPAPAEETETSEPEVVKATGQPKPPKAKASGK